MDEANPSVVVAGYIKVARKDRGCSQLLLREGFARCRFT